MQIGIRSSILRYCIICSEDSPSLHYELEHRLNFAYRKAVLLAAKETGLSESHFPEICPFTLGQVIDGNFWPD
jgi:hypothetical protein